MSTELATRFVSWLDAEPGTPTIDFLTGFGYLLFGDNGAPIRRNYADLMMMRKEYAERGERFPLDQLSLVVVNRVVARPLRFAQSTEQLGRVIAVAYDYPSYQKDPVIPVSLVPLGKEFDRRLRRLTRHIDHFGSGALVDHPRWGRRARKLVEQITASLPWGAGVLSERELVFIRYHLELTIAQPWRTK